MTCCSWRGDSRTGGCCGSCARPWAAWWSGACAASCGTASLRAGGARQLLALLAELLRGPAAALMCARPLTTEPRLCWGHVQNENVYLK